MMGALLSLALAGAAALSPPATGAEAAAEAFLQDLVAGRFREAAARFDETMAAALPQTKLAETWRGLVAQAGAFVRVDERRTGAHGAHTIVDLLGTFGSGPLVVRVVLRPDGRISGLWFLPVAQALPAGGHTEEQPPPYAEPARFHERDVTVGRAPWEVPGTLAMPKGNGPFPAVLLLAGSGPNDRDEAIGPRKPFRDIAWGLASAGIATLRYDKRTRIHGARMTGEVTVEEEVLADAADALQLLRRTDGVDPRRLFVCGHSLGAMLAPLVAARDGGLAGAILMAPAARPLDVMMEEQLGYILSLPGHGQERPQVEELLASICALRQGEMAEGAIVAGATKRYFDDLDGRDVTGVAASLRIPLLLMHGGRDYQVTALDLGMWRRALGGRASIHTYPELDHLFGAGEGPSTPESYMVPSPVDARVIDDLVSFVSRTPAP